MPVYLGIDSSTQSLSAVAIEVDAGKRGIVAEPAPQRALGLALLTGFLCGLAPAFAAIRTSVNETLKEGGRTGTLGSGHARLRSALVVAEIQDTGHGISEKNMPKIFDPFFTTKGDRRGTGLGLAVSYGFIERHRGQIEVQSEEGKRTTFTIKLPLQTSEDVPPV